MLTDWLDALLGLDREIEEVNALQMAVRAVTIYAFTLVIVRVGSKRFLGRATAFDVIMGFIIGSVMSRAINGSAPYFPTLVAGAVLIGMHWLLAVIAYHTRWFGPVVKGNPVLLVEDGQVNERAMRASHISRRDIEEALRLRGVEADLSRIRRAYLERDGRISVIVE
ncbi:MAG TPA: YetF domain-containing protein [Longimicrobiales bacterium]